MTRESVSISIKKTVISTANSTKASLFFSVLLFSLIFKFCAALTQRILKNLLELAKNAVTG